MAIRRTLAVLLLATMATVTARADDAAGLISPETLSAKLAAGVAVTVIDVRTAEEYASGHLPGAINVPYDEVEELVNRIGGRKDRPVVIYCRTGRRSQMAIETLKGRGFTAVLHLDGDLPAWQERGFGIEASRPPADAATP